MTTPYKEYRTFDKSDWGDGPWQEEPDKVQWADEATGVPCLAVRGRVGAWCGYVGVPAGHPLYGLLYSDAPDELHAASHRGVTFSNACHPEADEATNICHVPGEGDPAHVWWFGFDCAHYEDYQPQLATTEGKVLEVMNILLEAPFFRHTAAYRTLAYVKERCAAMAQVVAR